jgi:hypothetical protein
MGGLNGKIVVVMGKGRIHSKYVDLLGAELGTSAINLLNPFRDKGHQAQLNCLILRFDIKDGIAKTNPFVFDTDLMSVVADGKINLKTEALDLSIHPSPKKGVGISGIGQIGLSLGELAKPLKMSGTLANPSLAIDATQTAITLGKAVGGVMLFGPAGIAAALASGSVGEKNPCLEAIEAAKRGVEAKPKPEEKGQEEKASQGVTEDVQETIEGVGKGLKRLFGQ